MYEKGEVYACMNNTNTKIIKLIDGGEECYKCISSSFNNLSDLYNTDVSNNQLIFDTWIKFINNNVKLCRFEDLNKPFSILKREYNIISYAEEVSSSYREYIDIDFDGQIEYFLRFHNLEIIRDLKSEHLSRGIRLHYLPKEYNILLDMDYFLDKYSDCVIHLEDDIVIKKTTKEDYLNERRLLSINQILNS